MYLLVSKLSDTENVYLSVFERKEAFLQGWFLRFYLIQTRFRACILKSKRRLVSRYYLIKLVKHLGLNSDFEYCFSHSRRYSAAVLSASQEKFSVDIEPVERSLSGALRAKVRTLYPDLLVPDIFIIMILESLVKLSVFDRPFNLSSGLSEHRLAEIKSLKKNIFEVYFLDVKVFSKIYRFDDLYICITREKNDFRPCL